MCPVLVGRGDERGVLETALNELCSGHGQAIALTGEAGIGKSRLLTEISVLANAAWKKSCRRNASSRTAPRRTRHC